MAIDKAPYMREYYRQNRDDIVSRRRSRYPTDDRRKATDAEWRKKNRDIIRSRLRWRRIARVYGLSTQEFDAIFTKQGGKCAICGYDDMSDPNVFPVIDHCHSTNTVRGILCLRCNQALGSFKDDAARLRQAALYLDKADIVRRIKERENADA